MDADDDLTDRARSRRAATWRRDGDAARRGGRAVRGLVRRPGIGQRRAGGDARRGDEHDDVRRLGAVRRGIDPRRGRPAGGCDRCGVDAERPISPDRHQRRAVPPRWAACPVRAGPDGRRRVVGHRGPWRRPLPRKPVDRRRPGAVAGVGRRNARRRRRWRGTRRPGCARARRGLPCAVPGAAGSTAPDADARSLAALGGAAIALALVPTTPPGVPIIAAAAAALIGLRRR